jgi:hypothetical protein
MHLEGLQDALVIVTYGLAILILSIVADHKNRNPLVWGLIGACFSRAACSIWYSCRGFAPNAKPSAREGSARIVSLCRKGSCFTL